MYDSEQCNTKIYIISKTKIVFLYTNKKSNTPSVSERKIF